MSDILGFRLLLYDAIEAYLTNFYVTKDQVRKFEASMLVSMQMMRYGMESSINQLTDILNRPRSLLSIVLIYRALSFLNASWAIQFSTPSLPLVFNSFRKHLNLIERYIKNLHEDAGKAVQGIDELNNNLEVLRTLGMEDNTTLNNNLAVIRLKSWSQLYLMFGGNRQDWGRVEL